MSYGSSKESSGSTPSESSGSAPDESSSESSGVIDGGSSSSSGSSSSPCSFYLTDILYGGADDVMDFTVFNDGAGVLEIIDITGIAPLSPDTPLPIFLLSGTGITISVTATGTDLRGTPFTVVTSCGDEGGTFPIA